MVTVILACSAAACSGFSLGFSLRPVSMSSMASLRPRPAICIGRQPEPAFAASLLGGHGRSGRDSGAVTGIQMVQEERGEMGLRVVRIGGGGARGGSQGGARRGWPRNQDFSVVKDFGYCNGTSLQIIDSGNGPFVSWGPVNTQLPFAWKQNMENLSYEIVQELLITRLDACKVVRIVGLPHSTTLEDVETMLSEFSVSPGGIKLHFQRDGSFFGQVFVKFDEAWQATDCIREVNGIMIEGRDIRVYKQLSGGPFKVLQRADWGLKSNVTLKERLSNLVEDVASGRASAALQAVLDELDAPDGLSAFDQGLGLLPQNGNVSSLLSVANASEKTACKIISELGKRGEVEKAFAVYAWMQENERDINVFHFNALISACDRRGRYTLGFRLLGEMNVRNVAPDTITYSALISACGRGKQWEMAAKLLESMTSRGIRPNIITYNSLISACEKAGRLDQALLVFDKLLASGLDPDVITYSALISASEKVGSAETALELFKEMTACGLKPDLITFNALISACDKGLAPEQAHATFDRMVESGTEPDIISFCSLLSAYASVGDSESARKVMEMFSTSSIKPTTGLYNELLRSCEQQGLSSTAVTYYKDMKKLGVPVTAYSLGLLVNVCRKAEEAELAHFFEVQLAQCVKS